jgi:hypothetical protein
MPAPSSVPGLDSIRDLFTAAERAVLESTAGKALVAASRKQLEKTLAQARGLRDKWRDMHTGQARKTKRAGVADAAANARSRTKTDAFSAAIERLQGRLAELGLVAAPARPATVKAVTKAARTAGHRTARAEVKGKLAAAAAEITRSRSRPPVAVATTRRPATAAAPAAPAAPPPAAARGGKKASKKRRPAATAAAVLATGGQPLRFDAAKQRSAKASATAARLKFDGKVTRRSGHSLAAGKRRQAARDQRSR